MSHFKRISVYEAEHILAEYENVLLLDCRDANSYCKHHHASAVHLSDVNLRDLIKKTPKNVHIIIYCYHGNSSQDFAKLFADFGFEHCYSVDGGFDAWRQSSDFPVEPLNKPAKNWMGEHGFSEGDVDACNDEGLTPLMRAAFEGREDLVRALVNAGADPDVCDANGNNALWYACLARNVDCVRKLINADIDVDHTNRQGLSPINYAIACGRDDIIRELMAGGADQCLASLRGPSRVSKHLARLAS